MSKLSAYSANNNNPEMSMQTKIKSVIKPRKEKGLSRVEIQARLAELDLAHTSVLRDLEMDIIAQDGYPLDSVMKEARKLLAQ